MKVCCPLTPLLEKKTKATTQARCLAYECNGNHCADVKAVAATADFVNCSSFYANIYPTKISTKVRSINSNVLPLTEQQGSLSSSLPDLASVNAPAYRAAATSNELTFDGENFSPTDLTMTMLSAGERKKLSKSVDDALVDSPRSFDLWQKNRGSSSSSFSNTGSDNNKNGYGDEPCNSVVVLGKTNSLHGDDHNSQSGEEYSGETTQSSSHDLSSQTQNHCQQELNEKKSSLPGKQYLPGNIGHRVKTSSMSSLSVAIEQQTHANETLSSCVCNEISSEDEKSSKKNDEMPSSDWPPTVRTIEAHQLIDVEKEEEVLRQASMVSKGLYKQEETPPSQTTVDCREVIIEDVSDEEFQHKEVDNNCAAVDLEPPQDTGSKKKKIPKLNLDDPLLKGFEVALDKISLSNGDLASANSADKETVPPGDDPITKRAIERLDRKLQEVLKAGSNRLTPNSPSWQEKLPTLNSQASNGATEEVVQLRKQVKRPPTPKRRSAQSPCVLPNEEAGQKKDAPQTTDETSVGIAKSLVTVEVNAPEGSESLCPTADETSNGNKGIYKATFITPILRRKKSPPRPTLGTLRTSVISDDEPLDLRSFRSGHSDRVFSVPSSPVWPRFASRFMEPVPPTNSSFSQPLSSFDYHRSHCLPNSVETAGILRNDRYTPIGVGYNDSDRTMAQSPHQVLPDGDIWRWPNRDLNYHHPSSYEQVPVEHSPMQYRLGDSLSSMRVTSRRPLHAREQLRVFTDRPPSTTHLSSHFRSNSGELSSFMEQSAPYTSSFRNYVGPSFLGSSQDPVDPIAKKALERFDCCTTNSPRTFGSSTPSTMLANSNSSYDTYQDPIVRSAVMRMDNQLAAAYTANRRPDYSLSRRSSMNYVDTCDTIPESVNPLLSLRENGTSGSMAALGPKMSDGLRSREGSVPNTSLVDQLENRSAHNMRHIFNYLEDHDFKLSHSQSTLKQTPSRQYFSCSREYTRPRVRPGEISTDRRDGKSERLSQDPARTATDLERTPPQTRSYNDRLPPKHASDRQDGPLSEQLNGKQYLRTASSYSNLYIPKDVPGEGSSSVDFDSSVISATLEGPEASSGSVRAEASPAHPGIRQTVQIPISRQHSRRGQRPQKSGEHNDTPTADRCRSLERTPSNASGFAKGPRTIAVSGSPRVSPARNRRGLSVSTGQPKASRNGRSNGQPTVDNGARRKLDQKIPQPAGRLKQQQALLGRRAQTPRLSVVSNNTPKQSGEPEQDCWNGGRTTPLKWQMSVFERLYYNRKR